MKFLAKMPLQRNIGIFALVLTILVGGTWLTVKTTAEHLLHEHATSTAENWARFLAESVTDLEQIAGGQLPSVASTAFFENARRSGLVFRYEVFNRAGYSQLVSDREKMALVDLSEFSAHAARALQTREPVVDAKQSTSPGFPRYFAQAYVPVIGTDGPVALVAAYVDLSNQRDYFYRVFLIEALSLCLLIGLSFTLPAVAWYRRTKEKQIADRRIRFLAHYDALTGLANRATLIEKLHAEYAALPSKGGFAVHFIDLDRFKDVNDTIGHDGGDFLLTTVAERLRAVTGADNIIARLGGDEFVVLQSRVIDKEEAESFAKRLIVALTPPIHYNDHEIVASVSIGIAQAPADGTNPRRLLKSADLALYKAKADGRNCVRFFFPEMDAELLERAELERMVREAVRDNGFELHYQPLFAMGDRHLIGFEALIRLPKEDGTLVPPLVFIPVAEDIRLIDKVGAWVLQEACRTAATWPDELTVSVNLSPAQFLVGSISDIVADALKESGLKANRLELEITETLLLGDSASIMRELHALKAMGVAIVMDDFGTGYSSLSYLWRFPFDKIKIDRSFMQSFGDSGRDVATVMKTIIALGKELKMDVTVEGVETAAQAAFVDEAHGDQAQGYFFGRPMPASQVAASILADFQKTGGRSLADESIPERQAQGKFKLVK